MRRCVRTTISSPLLLVLILANLTTAAYAQFGGTTLPSLFSRQSACTGDPSSVSCGVADFCCRTGTRCILVEGNTSAVCCKIGEFCDEIFPVACNSETLASKSVQCGSQCCPAGYDCGANKDRCIMKPENLPPDHVANRDSRKSASDEAKREQCREFLGLAAGDHDDDDDSSKYKKFSFEGILVGLFPGIALGVAIMFAYTKAVELKTRRRTIHFNGRLSASPDDLSYIEQKPPPVPAIREDIAIGYSPSAPPATWRARTPADYSPNLGPTIALRERSVSRDRRGEVPSRATATPSPHPPATASLKSRPGGTPPHRTSTDSETSTDESDFSTAISQEMRGERHRRQMSDSSDDDDHGFSEVVIMDGTGHHSLSHREQRRGRPTTRASASTGYTMSVYQGREGDNQPPFELEEEVPPLRYGGSPAVGVGSPGVGYSPGYARF